MILFALALLATSTSDGAPQPSTPVTVTAPPSTAKPADDVDKVVCHVDTETGTRLGTHKECHTKREWAQMQAEEGNDLNRATSPH